MTYRIVQPQKNGKYYLYEARSVWNPEKKRSEQKRKYIGVCDEDGNLITATTKNRTIECSPVYGPYYLMVELMKQTGLDKELIKVYGEDDGKRLMALSIIGIISPCSTNQIRSEMEDTYLRELLGVDWSFEESEVCRFLQRIGKDTGRKERVFGDLAPKDGCVLFDIVCLSTDSERMDYSEIGRKTHLTKAKQINLGMIHSMKDGLPFCYRTYPGSVADVTTLNNIVSDLKELGCDDVELEMDRGFFSMRNVQMMIDNGMKYTVPIPSSNILKLLISESVSEITSPLTTESLCDSVVRGFESGVEIVDNKFERSASQNRIRAVVFQDDDRRTKEISTLYRRLNELERSLISMRYDRFIAKRLSVRELEMLNMLELSEAADGMFSVERKRNAISAKENACGRFAVLTTSDKNWKDLLIQYRMRNDIEYDFSQIQSDLFIGSKGKSTQESAEGGLFVNFLSLRLRLTLLERMRASGLLDTMWIPDLLRVLKKLKISHIGDKWRLNEVTKAQRDIFEGLKIDPPHNEQT